MENKKIYVALIHYHNNHYQAMGSTKDDAIAKLRNNIKNEVFDKWTSQRNYSLLRLDEKWSGFSRHVSGHVNNHAVLCTTECLSHIWNPGETKKEIDSKGNYFVVYEFDYNKEIKSLKNEALLFISFFDRVLNNINNDCKVIDEYQIENSGYYILQNIQKIKKGIFLARRERVNADIKHVGFEKGKYKWRIILKEGKNREIRRIFLKYNIKVYNLHRYAFGGFTLKGIDRGDSKKINKKEIIDRLKIS